MRRPFRANYCQIAVVAERQFPKIGNTSSMTRPQLLNYSAATINFNESVEQQVQKKRTILRGLDETKAISGNVDVSSEKL